MVAIWNAAPDNDYGKIIRLLFLSACRRRARSEDCGGRDRARGNSLIALPGSRTKNGLPHDVPLSGPARAIVQSLELKNRTRAFESSAIPASRWSKAKAELDALLGKNLAPWTLHDIRRTVATRMGAIGVQPHIVEPVLNHVSGHKRVWLAPITEARMKRRSGRRLAYGRRACGYSQVRPEANVRRFARRAGARPSTPGIGDDRAGRTTRPSPTGGSRSSCAPRGYVTTAEVVPDPKDYPGALPHMLYAGSLVFTPPPNAIPAFFA